jgi:hypothetical protein
MWIPGENGTGLPSSLRNGHPVPMSWYMNTSQIMARSGIRFQKGLSLPEFQRLYGTEEQGEAALEKARWPDWFRCPRST